MMYIHDLHGTAPSLSKWSGVNLIIVYITAGVGNDVSNGWGSVTENSIGLTTLPATIEMVALQWKQWNGTLV